MGCEYLTNKIHTNTINTIADIQHAITSALRLPGTWAKKVDYYNLGGHMANL